MILIHDITKEYRDVADSLVEKYLAKGYSIVPNPASISKDIQTSKDDVLESALTEIEKQFAEDCSETILYQEKPFKVSYYMLYKSLINTYSDEVEVYDVYSSNKMDSFELNKSELTTLADLLKGNYKDAYDKRKLDMSEAYITYNS